VAGDPGEYAGLTAAQRLRRARVIMRHRFR
jgi:hypothetical protein